GGGGAKQHIGGVEPVERLHAELEPVDIRGGDVEQAGFELPAGEGLGEVVGEQVERRIGREVVTQRCGHGGASRRSELAARLIPWRVGAASGAGGAGGGGAPRGRGRLGTDHGRWGLTPSARRVAGWPSASVEAVADG